jgi:hypothetical protein
MSHIAAIFNNFMGIMMMFLHQQSLLLLLLPPLVKVQLLVTKSLNEVERRGHQPLQVMLKTTTQPLQVMLGASTHPPQLMLGALILVRNLDR